GRWFGGVGGGAPAVRGAPPRFGGSFVRDPALHGASRRRVRLGHPPDRQLGDRLARSPPRGLALSDPLRARGYAAVAGAAARRRSPADPRDLSRLHPTLAGALAPRPGARPARRARSGGAGG